MGFFRVKFHLMAAAFFFFAAASGLAQTPITLPTLPPDEPPPSQPTFAAPVKPMPDLNRVGVDADDSMPLSIEQAIEMALKNNNDIDASRNDTQINQFNLKAARGIFDPILSSDNYYESVTTPTASAIGGAVNGAVTQKRLVGAAGVNGFSPFAGGSYSALFNASRSTTSNTNSFLNPQFPSSLAFAYTQPLWRGRRIDVNRRNILVAKKNIELTDSQLQLTAITTVNGVEQAYWDLVYALRNQQVQVETLQQAKDQLESNKRLVEKGVLAPIEIVAANAQISAFEQAVFAANEAVTRAENAIKAFILPDRTAAEWRRPLMPVTPVERSAPQIGLEVATTEALKNRPEIAQLETTADINKIDQRFYRDQTKPQIDLVSTYTASGLAGTTTPAAISPTTGQNRVPTNLIGGIGTSLGNLAALDYPSYRIGVNISLPWRNTIAKANLGRVLVQADKIANNRAQAEQTIEADVRNSLQALRSAESRLTSATDARVAAEELYNSEVRLFRGGTSTFYLVAQRQTALAQARAAEVQARTNLNKAISTFNRSIGATLTVNNLTVQK